MKVSIITVCLNSEKFIRSAIESVLAQNYVDIEYIVVDGASTDQTVDIIKSYEPLFNGRMKWISEKDKGIYDAMNKGIALTTGDLVGILNSDDVFANNNVVTKVVETVTTQNSDGVYGDLVYVQQKDLNKVTRYWKSKKYTDRSFKLGWMPPHPTFFAKRVIFEKYGTYHLEYKIAADYEFLLRIIYKNKSNIAYLPETLVKMRVGGESNKSLKNRIRGNRDDKKAWKENNLKPYPFTLILKPLRKIFQFFSSPKLKV